jgi:hypothetical protein
MFRPGFGGAWTVRLLAGILGVMSLRLWGCYSVKDHLESRAFVADLLLYDRLVVPVPTGDDMARWEKRWDPDRQKTLLDVAAPFVERVPWDAALRDEFTREYSSATAAAEIDSISRHAAGLDPYELTRQLITEHIRGDVLQEEPGGDIRAVAVYAQPDRFDREWAINRTFPFFHKTTRVEPGRLREVSDVLPTDVQRLAKLVVTRLVVPDDGRDDAEVLQKTVELISRDDTAQRRADFQAAIARFHATGLRDETIVGEIEDLLAALNASVKNRTNAQRSRTALQFATAAEGAAALWAPPIAVATGPTAAFGEALIQRRWDETTPPGVDAVSLLARAQNALKE